MFRFRGQRVDNNEWITGYCQKRALGYYIIPDYGDYEFMLVRGETLSVSFGILDSKKKEIFASFILWNTNIMTKGGDVVSVKGFDGKKYGVKYSINGSEFIIYQIGVDSDFVWNISNAYIDDLTIIGKQIDI